MSDHSPSEHLRVLHLGSPAGLYGAERWILALAKNLPRARVESWIAVIKDSPDLEAPLCQEAQRFGIQTHVFTSYGKLSLSAISQIRRFIREKHVDVVHTHGYKTDILATLATCGTPCVTVATPHGWSVNAGMALKLYESLDRIVFNFMDAVVPLSPDLLAGLERLPGLRRRLHLIRNGVDLSDVDAAAASEGATRRDDLLVIGYIGQLITRKQVDTLIRAFHRLELPRRRLCIIGDGPQRVEYERLASELGETARIAFMGFRDDRLRLMKGFDLFVLPSELEGIPRCLMEAMASGVPVVASDIPGNRDLVLDGTTGLLFRAGDDVGLARQIARLAQDSDLRARFGEAGRRLVREKFSAESMSASYLALYRRLVDRIHRPQAVKEPA